MKHGRHRRRARPGGDARRGHRLAVRARGARRRRSTRSSSTKPASTASPTRSPAGRRRSRLVLLGDPLQLAQVTQGVHPDGSGASRARARARRARDDPARSMGVFLEQTRRMHPDVCRFISEAFYEGRLRSIAECCASGRPRTASASAGSPSPTRETASTPRRRRTRSPRRSSGCSATRSATRTASGRSARATSWSSRPTTRRCGCSATRLPTAVEVGTVDKFQGREAPVVFYSMASSSGEDVPRGLDFLLSRNRLNVAVSRAQCLAYVACSPRLLEVDCRTVEQLKLANALCLFVEARAPARRAKTLLHGARSPCMRVLFGRLAVRRGRHARRMARTDRALRVVPGARGPAGHRAPAERGAGARCVRRGRLETTGTSVEADEIVSLAVVRLAADGLELDRFASLVRPAGPIPAGGDRGARDRRHVRRRCAELRRARAGAVGAARRRGLRRAQRGLRSPAPRARVRTRRDPVPPHRRRVHARRVPAARAGREEPPARVDLPTARHRARRRARRALATCSRPWSSSGSCSARGSPRRPSSSTTARYMRLRSRGDTRPVSEPQIRRVFALARSAGLVLPDGSVDADACRRARRAGRERRGRRGADARAGAGGLRRARAPDRRAPGRSARGRARRLIRAHRARARGTSPRRGSTRSSTRRTRRCSAAAGWTARSTGRAGRRSSPSAARCAHRGTQAGCRPGTRWRRPPGGSPPAG